MAPVTLCSGMNGQAFAELTADTEPSGQSFWELGCGKANRLEICRAHEKMSLLLAILSRLNLGGRYPCCRTVFNEQLDLHFMIYVRVAHPAVEIKHRTELRKNVPTQHGSHCWCVFRSLLILGAEEVHIVSDDDACVVVSVRALEEPPCRPEERLRALT